MIRELDYGMTIDALNEYVCIGKNTTMIRELDYGMTIDALNEYVCIGKNTTMIRELDYGMTIDALNEYVCIGKNTTMESLKHLCCALVFFQSCPMSLMSPNGLLIPSSLGKTPSILWIYPPSPNIFVKSLSIPHHPVIIPRIARACIGRP
jgi:hypothetical protein